MNKERENYEKSQIIKWWKMMGSEQREMRWESK